MTSLILPGLLALSHLEFIFREEHAPRSARGWVVQLRAEAGLLLSRRVAPMQSEAIGGGKGRMGCNVADQDALATLVPGFRDVATDQVLA